MWLKCYYSFSLLAFSFYLDMTAGQANLEQFCSVVLTSCGEGTYKSHDVLFESHVFHRVVESLQIFLYSGQGFHYLQTKGPRLEGYTFSWLLGGD